MPSDKTGTLTVEAGWQDTAHREDDVDSDEALMLAFADGDSGAFERLYRRHRAPLYRFVLRAVGAPMLAEELYQDVWMRLIDAKSRYRVTARFQTFLYRIAHNRVIDHYRAHRSHESLSEPAWQERLADPGALEPGRLLDGDAGVARLRAALLELPLEQRTALVLQLENGLSLETIGAICGVGRETVKSRLRYAVARLRDRLGDFR